MKARVRLLVAVLLFRMGTARSEAQGRPGAIVGLVTDSSLAPLGDASVSILGSTVRVVTGASGRFRIVDVAPGQSILLVRRIGFDAATAVVQVTDGETQRLSFVLQRASTVLDTITVSSKQLGWRMSEFAARRTLGEGQFMAEAEIEKRNVAGLSDLLGIFKGIYVAPGGGPVCPKRATGPHDRPCQLQVFLDGILMPPLDINEYALPKELAGIEMYLRPSAVPLQYKTTSGGGFCGVILLWTRVGA